MTSYMYYTFYFRKYINFTRTKRTFSHPFTQNHSLTFKLSGSVRHFNIPIRSFIKTFTVPIVKSDSEMAKIFSPNFEINYPLQSHSLANSSLNIGLFHYFIVSHCPTEHGNTLNSCHLARADETRDIPLIELNSINARKVQVFEASIDQYRRVITHRSHIVKYRKHDVCMYTT